jgi:glycolate oxidase subunit GlcD
VDRIIENLREAVGREGVLTERSEMLVYECDGLPQHKFMPRAVVFPRSTEEVARVVGVLAENRIPFAPRGAGTGLSGGALALNGSVIIELAKMRRLINLNVENRLATVETGMVNAHVSRIAAPFGLHYVPDPSSGATCTIGGNIAENAGGIHCLKYGMTVDHVLAARVVLSDGEIVDLGNRTGATEGYDLLGVFIGSEGTFGIATEATVRLTTVPPAVRTMLADFARLDDGSRAVSAIIAAGIIPAALEMIDGRTIRAIEASLFRADLPLDSEAALLVEIDGLEAGLEAEAARVAEILRANNARTVRHARDAEERKRLWAARKNAFGAMGRIAPDLMLQDAVVPRSRLPETLAEINRIGLKYDLTVANVFHAGDGNLHPFICFDSRDHDQVRRVKDAGREMMEVCVRAGGTITGEHGVGIDKSEYLPMIFTPDDMDAMLCLRAAFDPSGLCNPGKIIPVNRSCGEARGAAKRSGALFSGSKRSDNIISVSNETPHFGAQNSTRALNESVSEFTSSKLSSGGNEAVSHSTKSFDDARRALAQIIGEANIADAMEGDALSVAPASIEELRETIKLAAREHWRVMPAGAGLWLDAGDDARTCMIVSTKRLARIIEHEPADLTATAEAGMTLARLNAELGRAGQFLALDPPDDGRATVGGTAATNSAGAHSLAYGTPRNSITGMKILLSDGRIIRAGGRVVKNVAGYDLVKLFTGSFGTLGIITEITFKLRPLPECAKTLMARGSLHSLFNLRSRILSAVDLFPIALEILSPAMSGEIFSGTATGEEECALLVRFAGNAEAVNDQIERAMRLSADEIDARRFHLLADEVNLWSAIAKYPLLYARDISWRASVPRTEIHNFVRASIEAIDKLSLDSCAWHASANHVRFMHSSPPDNEKCARQLENLRGEAMKMGGMLVAERAPREIKRMIGVWSDERDTALRRLMNRIKERFDPQNMFSPGRFSLVMSSE